MRCRAAARLRAAYEAGPSGRAVYRTLQTLGIASDVVARAWNARVEPRVVEPPTS